MATAQLYHYIAPKEETTIIAKPLIRLLRSHRYNISINSVWFILKLSYLEKYKALFLATLPPSQLREV